MGLGPRGGHGARSSGWARGSVLGVGTGLTGQMEHENGGSEYLKKNSSLEGAGSAWEGSMMNREGSPWLRALGVRGFVLDLCIELLKGLQWTAS